MHDSRATDTLKAPFWALVVGVVATMLILVAANYGVNVPINDWVTWGHFIFPLVFLVTDLNNKLFGAKVSGRVVAVSFLIGGVLIFFVVSPRLAAASAGAFLIGQLVDVVVFQRLRQQIWWRAPVVSSIIASAVDSAVFYVAAFWGTGLPWVQWGIADFFIKFLMIFPLIGPMWMVVYWLRKRLS